jgi:hypothetical protein
MAVEPCRIVAESPGVLGLRSRVTLSSPLSPDIARERLAATLPRFDVPPDVPFVLKPLRRRYTGSIQDGSFRLAGPWGRYVGAWLFVRGAFEPRGRGSLVQLIVSSPHAVVIAAICLAAAIGMILMLLMADWGGQPFHPLMILVSAVYVLPPVVVGLVGVLWSLAAIRRQRTYLIGYLQTLFAADVLRSAETSRQREAVEDESLPAPLEAALRTDRTIFRANMVVLGGIGGLLAVTACVTVSLIFVLPAWQDYRSLQEMAETRCRIVDSRLIEIPGGNGPTLYKPEFLIHYEAAGAEHEVWAFASERFAGYTARAAAEEKLRDMAVGEVHVCWHDPSHPERVVLDRTSGAWPLLACGGFFALMFGGGALGLVGLAVSGLRKRQVGSRQTGRPGIG